MNLSDQQRGGNTLPNLDLYVDTDPAETLPSKNPSLIQAEGQLATVYAGGDEAKFLGIMQGQPPPPGGQALIRLFGITYVVFGGTVAEGDALVMSQEVGMEGTMIPWVDADHGHTHSTQLQSIQNIVFATDLKGLPALGLSAGDFNAVAEWWQVGFGMTALSTPTITEISGGDYLIEYTPAVAGTLVRLRLSNASYIFTPDQFQEMSSVSVGQATGGRWIMGRALTGGAVGDSGLMLLRPQRF